MLSGSFSRPLRLVTLSTGLYSPVMLEFLEIPPEYEMLVNMVFLAVTGYIAWHGIRYRDEEGRTDFVRLLFGSIAAFFFFGVLFQDVLGLIRF